MKEGKINLYIVWIRWKWDPIMFGRGGYLTLTLHSPKMRWGDKRITFDLTYYGD